jgi:aminoglycoside phosphotransferase
MSILKTETIASNHCATLAATNREAVELAAHYEPATIAEVARQLVTLAELVADHCPTDRRIAKQLVAIAAELNRQSVNRPGSL